MPKPKAIIKPQTIDRIITEMRRIGLSQEALAEAMDNTSVFRERSGRGEYISQASIHNVIAGKSELTRPRAAAMAEVFDVLPEWLLGETDFRTSQERDQHTLGKKMFADRYNISIGKAISAIMLELGMIEREEYVKLRPKAKPIKAHRIEYRENEYYLTDDQLVQMLMMTKSFIETTIIQTMALLQTNNEDLRIAFENKLSQYTIDHRPAEDILAEAGRIREAIKGGRHGNGNKANR